MDGWTEGWVDGQTYEQNFSPFYSTLSPIRAAAQKDHFGILSGGGITPSGAAKFGGLVPVGANFCSHISSKTRKKKDLPVKS